jgi:hypothetical protein
MAAKQEFTDLVMLAVVVAVTLLSECPCAHSEEKLVLPNFPDIDSTPFSQVGKSSTTRDDFGESNVLGKSLRGAPSVGASTNRNNQLRLGIQTEKNLQVIDPLKRSECMTEDECTDYSGLPKSGPIKRSLKNLRKPFFGLSISKPIQW